MRLAQVIVSFLLETDPDEVDPRAYVRAMPALKELPVDAWAGVIRCKTRGEFFKKMEEFGVAEYHVKAPSKNRADRYFRRIGGGLISTDSYNGYYGIYGSHAAAWIPPEKLKNPHKAWYS